MASDLSGVSAMSLYVPPFRVNLESWCGWTGNSWEKISAVVGRSFRVPGRHENVYTMAANAVLRLIRQNDVDPSRIGFLGLGTESSTDNAAGAVIVRGMVDRALESLGQPRLSRHLEVPEFKHACLGGIYALKSALRYAVSDGAEQLAIVVSADVAEYERGSRGGRGGGGAAASRRRGGGGGGRPRRRGRPTRGGGRGRQVGRAPPKLVGGRPEAPRRPPAPPGPRLPQAVRPPLH